MTPADLETVYEALAEDIDRVGPEKSALFLSKLALLLAQDIGTAAPVLARIKEASAHLTVETLKP
ncbi:DUF2783 domain-containing protein [Celeribacter ethanolicus]|nr:DUF2783 domain-containing protein [Celeribacter ethanolicus]TNE67831.1 MAG: DUF2783 domain-containing protein [Paracoccaceae bacterium]